MRIHASVFGSLVNIQMSFFLSFKCSAFNVKGQGEFPSSNFCSPLMCEPRHKLLEEVVTVAAKLRTSGATCGDLFSCLYSQTLAYVWHWADRSPQT